MMHSLDNIEDEIVSRATQAHIDVRGPIETAYGYGWPPTITFWHGIRRIHYYFDLRGSTDGLTVEVAEIDTQTTVLIGTVQSVDELWNIIDCFLHQQCTFDELPNYSWKRTSANVDKFIPHPPDLNNPANIAQLLQQPGATIWQPPQTNQNKFTRMLSLIRQFFNATFLV